MQPTESVIRVMRRNKFRFYYELVAICARGAALILPLMNGKGIETGILTFALTSACFNLMLIYLTYIFVRKQDVTIA